MLSSSLTMDTNVVLVGYGDRTGSDPVSLLVWPHQMTQWFDSLELHQLYGVYHDRSNKIKYSFG
jgi:hypothetical protein